MGQCMVGPSIESGMSYEFDLGQVYIGESSGQHKSRQGQEGPGPGAIQSRSGRADQRHIGASPRQGHSADVCMYRYRTVYRHCVLCTGTALWETDWTSMKPGQYLRSLQEARLPIFIHVIAFPEPGMSPAPSVWDQQKAHWT